jgi:hypothetical protein
LTFSLHFTTSGAKKIKAAVGSEETERSIDFMPYHIFSVFVSSRQWDFVEMALQNGVDSGQSSRSAETGKEP